MGLESVGCLERVTVEGQDGFIVSGVTGGSKDGGGLV